MKVPAIQGRDCPECNEEMILFSDGALPTTHSIMISSKSAAENFVWICQFCSNRKTGIIDDKHAR